MSVAVAAETAVRLLPPRQCGCLRLMRLCWRPRENTIPRGMSLRLGRMFQMRMLRWLRLRPAGLMTWTEVMVVTARAAVTIAWGGLMAPALLGIQRLTQRHLCQRPPLTLPHLRAPLLLQGITMLRRLRLRKRLRPWPLPRTRLEAMTMLKTLTEVLAATPVWDGPTAAITTAPLA